MELHSKEGPVAELGCGVNAVPVSVIQLQSMAAQFALWCNPLLLCPSGASWLLGQASVVGRDLCFMRCGGGDYEA